MKSKISVTIETRNDGQNCSWRCPHLRAERDDSIETRVNYTCMVFRETLNTALGVNAVRRCPKCVTAEAEASKLPHPNPPKIRAKPLPRKAPTAWDRITLEDKL